MDDLTIGGSTPPPSAPLSPSSSPSIPTSPSLDTVEDANSSNYSFNLGEFIILPGPSILSYSNHLLTTGSKHKEQVFREEQTNSINLNPLFLAALAEINEVRRRQALVIELVHQKQDFADRQNDKIDDIEVYRTNYNTIDIPADNLQIDRINAAVVAYNTAVDTHIAAGTAYSSAVATYNAAKQVFDAAVDAYEEALAVKQAADEVFAFYTEMYENGELTQAQYDQVVAQHNAAVTAFNSAQETYNAAGAVYNAAGIAKAAADAIKATADAAYVSARSTYTNLLTLYNNYANNVSDQRDFVGRIANLIAAYNAYVQFGYDVAAEISEFNELVALEGFDIPLINPRPDTTADLPLFQLMLPALIRYPLPSGPALPPANDTKITTAPIDHDVVLSAPERFNPRITDEQVQAMIATAFASIQQNTLDILSKILRDIKMLQDYLGFFEDGKPVPKAYIEGIPKVFLKKGAGVSNPDAISSSGVGAGAGIYMSMLTKALENGNLKATLDQGLYDASNKTPIHLNSIATQLQVFNNQLLKDIALFSSLPSLGALAGKQNNGGADSPIVDITFAEAFANQIINAVKSNEVENSILEILKVESPASDIEGLKKLAEQLAANSKLFFLQVGLSQLSQALGFPDLTAKVIAASDAAKNLITFPINHDIELKDVLRNPLSTAFLKNYLTSQLTTTTTTFALDAIQNLINKAINDAVDQAIKNFKELQEALAGALQKALEEQGLSKEDAQKQAIELADRGRAFVEEEVRANYFLDTGLEVAKIDREKLIQSIVQQNKKDAAAQDSELISESLIQGAIDAARLSYQNQTDISQRQLRDRIADELRKKADISDNNALRLSTVAVIGDIQNQIPKPVTGNESISEIKKDVADHIKEVLTPTTGVKEAENTAHQVLKTIFGSTIKAPEPAAGGVPLANQAAQTALVDKRTETAVADNSLIQQYDKHIAKLETFGRELKDDGAFIKELGNEQRTYLRPTLEIYVRNDELRDPGIKVIHNGYTGIMYQDDLPRDWNQNIFV